MKNKNIYISWKKLNWQDEIVINMILEAIEAKEWSICIDTEWKITDYFLHYVSKYVKKDKNIIEDIAFIDLWNEEYINWLNLFAWENIEKKTQYMLDLFKDIYWKNTFNLNLREYLYNSMMILSEDKKTLNFMNMTKIFKWKKIFKEIVDPLISSWVYEMSWHFNEILIKNLDAIIAPFTQWQLWRILNVQPNDTNEDGIEGVIKSKKIIIIRLPKNKFTTNQIEILYKTLLLYIYFLLSDSNVCDWKDRYNLFLKWWEYVVWKMLSNLLELSLDTNINIVFLHQDIQQLKNLDYESSISILKNILKYFDTHMLFRQIFWDEQVYTKEIYWEDNYLNQLGDQNLSNLLDKEYILYNCDINKFKKCKIETDQNIEDIDDKIIKNIGVIKEINNLKFGTKRSLVDKKLTYISRSTL